MLRIRMKHSEGEITLNATENKQATHKSNGSRRSLYLISIMTLVASTLFFFQNCGQPFETAQLASGSKNAIQTPATSGNGGVAGNQPPSVAITTPNLTTTSLNAGTAFVVNATAADSTPGGSVTRVELYINGTMVANDNTAPYVLTANNIREGNYAYYVKAIDNNNGFSTTASRTLNAVLNPLDPNSYCFANDYFLPSWNDASDVTLTYTIGLGPNSPTIADVTSTYSPRGGKRPVANVTCNRVSGPDDLDINCDLTRIRIRTGQDIECASGTVVVEARPRDGCMNMNANQYPKKHSQLITQAFAQSNKF
jgi:hypothetical protein